MLVFRNASSLDHDPRAFIPGHPDTPERIAAIDAALDALPSATIDVRDAPPAGEADLHRVHTPALVAKIRDLSAHGGGRMDADTAVSAGSFKAALHTAGGACALVRALLTEAGARAGFAYGRPSGHHAEPERAMGFCLFNNIAIAAACAIEEFGLERVLILDWDVHHGNGTAEAFRHRSDVLVAGIHQIGLFPGTGSISDAGTGAGLGYTINAPVPAGSGDEVWISVLEHVIVPAALDFHPELVLISAGFDAHRADPVGGCDLDVAAFGQMACHARDLAREAGAPIGAVLEGGYDPPSLAESVLATLHALDGEGEAESIAPDPMVTPRLAAHVGHFWTL